MEEALRCSGWWTGGRMPRWCSPTAAAGRPATHFETGRFPGQELAGRRRGFVARAMGLRRAAEGGAPGLRRRNQDERPAGRGGDRFAALRQGRGRMGKGLRVFRRGLRRAAAAPDRIRGRHDPRALPGPGATPVCQWRGTHTGRLRMSLLARSSTRSRGGFLALLDPGPPSMPIGLAGCCSTFTGSIRWPDEC